ncbi:MAG: DUF481 domain-containing protein [Acidobacteria bacterium]|nr:DUF481 domain-containing protein [Acidobacteriota bacterium]
MLFRRTHLMPLALCLAGVLYARPKTDVIVMSNGDKFTCEIKKLDRGVLYASFDYAEGTVSIAWAKVARVESNQPFIVYTQEGSVYKGSIHSMEAGTSHVVQIEPIEEEAPPTSLEPTRVVELAQTSEVIWRRFSGSFDSGLMFTKGNDTTQYSLGADVRIRGEHWRLVAEYLSNFSKSAGVTASARNQTRIGARRLIGGKRNWYVSGGSEFLQSSQQDISLQSTLSGGVGRFVKDTNTRQISVTAGLAYQSTQYASTAGRLAQPNSMAAAFNSDLHLFHFKKSGLDLTTSVLPLLTDLGRVRAYVNSAYKIQLVSNLWFKVSFYGSWDSRPPANLAGADYGVSSGISYSFN